MRDINGIVIHCSATREGQEFTAADIRKWHVEKNGWADIGYHFVVRLDGTVEAGRTLDRTGAHVSGYNANTIGICYIGGLDSGGAAKDTRTEAQKGALRGLVAGLRAAIPSIATVMGHRDYPNVHKDCPCFDVKTQL